MLTQELINFAVYLFITWLVWRSYRKSSFTIAQKYSTFWPRFWTGTVDLCVLWPLALLLSLTWLLKPLPVAAVAFSLLSNAIGLTYTVWMHAWRGQTVGKIVCRVRVVDNLTEGPITLRQALLRECVPLVANLGVLGYILYLEGSGSITHDASSHPERAINWRVLGPLMATPALWFLIEVITMFSNRKRRALHDLIADTTVVRTHLIEA